MNDEIQTNNVIIPQENQENKLHFLSDIEKEDNITKKFRIFNKALQQEPIIVKNLKDEMKRKGLNAGGAQDFEYVPIEVVEEALRQIFFGQVDFILKKSYRDLNTLIVEARIRYKSPVTNEYRVVDGIGAKAIQQDKNATIQDFNSTMKANGLELGVGIAYSRAIKNAAKKLGKLFGADLNKDEEIDNITVYSKKIVN